jgi:hypothetical protein
MLQRDLKVEEEMSEKLFKKMEMQIKQNTVQFENHVNTYNAEISLLASKKEL